MRIYLDSSALIKRAVREAESAAVVTQLREHVAAGDTLWSATLAAVEISRFVRRQLDRAEWPRAEQTCLGGVALRPIDNATIAIARRLTPPTLRSLDAIHLASALACGADLLVAYDQRLLDAALSQGIPTAAWH